MFTFAFNWAELRAVEGSLCRAGPRSRRRPPLNRSWPPASALAGRTRPARAAEATFSAKPPSPHDSPPSLSLRPPPPFLPEADGSSAAQVTRAELAAAPLSLGGSETCDMTRRA